jgi:glucokinase
VTELEAQAAAPAARGPLVGVDLGGTLIRAAVATGPASHGPPVRHPTPPGAPPDAVLDAIAAAVREATAGATPGGMAIGIPGPLDPERGIVYAAPNLHGFAHLQVQAPLEQRLGCPVAIHNDANLAGYAEWVAGAAKGVRHMVFITVSTGVGGGLVLNGELFAGAAGTAGEIGHMPIDPNGPPCGQGHPGCLEGTASGTAIAARAHRLLDAGQASTLSALPRAQLDARAVADAAEAGDQLAIDLYHHAGHALGRAIGGLVNLLSPEVVVVGGGLINAGDLLLAPMRAGAAELAFPEPLQRCPIVPAALGTDAGLVGAVAWAVRRFATAGAAA